MQIECFNVVGIAVIVLINLHLVSSRSVNLQQMSFCKIYSDHISKPFVLMATKLISKATIKAISEMMAVWICQQIIVEEESFEAKQISDFEKVV